MSFWERLDSILSEKNLTAAELGRRIDVSPTVINSWKIRGSIPRADIVCKTAKALDTSVEYLMSGEELKITNSKVKNTFLVPILNQELSAGKGSLLPDEDSIKGLVALPSFMREFGENLAGLYVHGDSMEPTLKNGDLVICTSLGWDNGEGLYAIQFNGNGYIKRIQVAAGKIIIRSDNPKYEPIEEPAESDNFKIIGKVVLIIQSV